MPAYSREQVLALAPDASSASAGQALSGPAKWSNTGHDDAAVWGECAGSGKVPYRTQVALGDGASKCSCPSRKFPCKHAIGLLLLQADRETREGQQPEWVREWVTSRGERKQKQKTDKAPDPQAVAKRAQAREKKVDGGIAELGRWLEDLARTGLAQAQTQPWPWWDAVAARMVDAQAKGLAGKVRGAASTAALGSQRADWAGRLLDQVASMHLLTRAWPVRDTLPSETQLALATRIGATTPTEEVLTSGERVRDFWTVIGHRVTDDGQLRTLQQWLRGTRTGRVFLLLAFAAGAAPLDAGLAPGMSTEAELALYPGSRPQRVLVADRLSDPAPAGRLQGAATWDEALLDVAEALAFDPWSETYPLVVDGVTVLPGRTWRLRDSAGTSLPLEAEHWPLLAVSEGRPVDVAAEWDGFALRPLAVARAGRALQVLP